MSKETSEPQVIIVTVRGTVHEREGLNAGAKREGVSVNRYVRERLGMRNETPRERAVQVASRRVDTPHGTFTLSRRALYGFSVVRARRDAWHHGRRLFVGELAIVEHRKRPQARAHIGMGWSEHVATYDLAGTLQEYPA